MKPKARILVVDDEKIVCDVCRAFLTKDGFDVTTFTDSRQALSALETEDFDLLITDLKMRDVDGIRLLETAKRIDAAKPVILLTAFGTLETAVEAFRKQAFDYFTKPVRIRDLQAAVHRALGHAPEGE
jgi:DNA-binding NtrC family response regulator